jgi:hypothetical protein
MKASRLYLLIILSFPVFAGDAYVQRFSELAVSCIHQEYPNQILHHVSGAGEMGEPHELYPAFYGCFDWHSSVHAHWLLTRLLNVQEQGLDRQKIITALGDSFTEERLANEVRYFSGEDRAGFERPYGRAWFLQLTAELREWDSPDARGWLQTLLPLEEVIIQQTMSWLPNLTYPIRSGTHSQTAFAFGLMLDSARTAGNQEFEQLLVSKIREFYRGDQDCPIAYEPSGEDFLSPCLMEADLMRRVMSETDFSRWLAEFLPEIPTNGSDDWLAVGVVLDATDGKLVHLDGLNLSRAWALYNIAMALPKFDSRVRALKGSAVVHSETGLASVTGDHYAGGHWLASFATYLTTKRGL